MVTDKMVEAFYSKAEVTRRGTILHLAEALEAALSASDAKPVGYVVYDAENKEGRFFKHRPMFSHEDMAEFEISIDPVYLAALPAVASNAFNVDDLAQEIRRVDGENSLGAVALAEALMPFIFYAVASLASTLSVKAPPEPATEMPKTNIGNSTPATS